MFGQTAFSGYSVNDIELAKRFYAETLGLKIEEQPGMGFRIAFPNGHSVFIYAKPDHEPADFTVLNFPVDDIDSTVDNLTARGITFEHYNSLPAAQDEKGVLRGLRHGYGPDIAWFKDPGGNVLAVLQDH